MNSRNVAADSDYRRIHDRVDAARLALAQLLHRVHHPRVLIPGIWIVGVVLPHIGAEDKYVLMHQHLAQVGDADRPADGFHYGHSSSVVSKRYCASSHRISDRTVGAPCCYPGSNVDAGLGTVVAISTGGVDIAQGSRSWRQLTSALVANTAAITRHNGPG